MPGAIELPHRRELLPLHRSVILPREHTCSSAAAWVVPLHERWAVRRAKHLRVRDGYERLPWVWSTTTAAAVRLI
jgi:hypothetical protein